MLSGIPCQRSTLKRPPTTIRFSDDDMEILVKVHGREKSRNRQE